MQPFKILQTVTAAASITGGSLGAATVVDGSSGELAFYSARQLSVNGLVKPDGIYWTDADQGLNGSATSFQTFYDLTTFGGGFTLGVSSRDAVPATSIDIRTNTGAVGTPFNSSYTRNLDYLGIAQAAQFLYHVRLAGAGTTVFLGTYNGYFDDVHPSFAVTIDTLGLNGQMDRFFDFHSSRNLDVVIELRETTSPPLRAVPEVSTLMLAYAGFGIAFVGRRRSQRKKMAPFSPIPCPTPL